MHVGAATALPFPSRSENLTHPQQTSVRWKEGARTALHWNADVMGRRPYLMRNRFTNYFYSVAAAMEVAICRMSPNDMAKNTENQLLCGVELRRPKNTTENGCKNLEDICRCPCALLWFVKWHCVMRHVQRPQRPSKTKTLFRYSIRFALV